MAGQTISANWAAGEDGDDGRFTVLVITEDDARHVVAPSPEAMTAPVALMQGESLLLWDLSDRTLIVANVVGMMPWTEGMQSAQQAGEP